MKENNKKILIIVFLLSIAIIGIASMSFVSNISSGVENVARLPRFVILNSNEINVRVGPGVKYPISFVLKNKGLPVEIVREFDIWRQIVTIEGDKGWVHQSMLSGARRVIVKDYTRTVYRKPNLTSNPVVKLRSGVIAKLYTCKENWCRVEASGFRGWIERESIWGVYPDEVFED